VNKFHRKIHFLNEVGWFGFDDREIFALFSVLDFSLFKISKEELSVALLDEETMQNLHRKFSNDSTLTDLITFVGDRQLNFAREICVSPITRLAIIKPTE
jgi:ssRNA-specific RNase YbeY (16S rRNA maturation enzyme)